MRFLLLSFLPFLAGCCAAESCECAGQEAADDLALRFSRDTTGTAPAGFTQAETSRLLVIRAPVDPASRVRTDTVVLDAHSVPANGQPDVLIRRDRPFSRSALGLAGYRYRVAIQRKPGFRVVRSYELRDVFIESRYATVSSCCTCYENIRKEARLDGGPLLDLRSAPGSNPTVVELRKR